MACPLQLDEKSGTLKQNHLCFLNHTHFSHLICLPFIWKRLMSSPPSWMRRVELSNGSKRWKWWFKLKVKVVAWVESESGNHYHVDYCHPLPPALVSSFLMSWTNLSPLFQSYSCILNTYSLQYKEFTFSRDPTFDSAFQLSRLCSIWVWSNIRCCYVQL